MLSLSNKQCMNSDSAWPRLGHTSDSLKRCATGQLPSGGQLRRVFLHGCLMCVSVAVFDEKDIGGRWGISHTHSSMRAPHSANALDRDPIYRVPGTVRHPWDS